MPQIIYFRKENGFKIIIIISLECYERDKFIYYNFPDNISKEKNYNYKIIIISLECYEFIFR